MVLRQPFGGLGRSSFGPGMKAGGPNYVAQFMRFEDRAPVAGGEGPLANAALASLAKRITGEGSPLFAEERTRLLCALRSYDRAWAQEFGREHDALRLLGQDNCRRYLPFAGVRVRVDALDTAFDIIARVAAARVTGARVIVSLPPGLDSAVADWLDLATEEWGATIEFVEESSEDLNAHLAAAPPHAIERLRFAGRDRVPMSPTNPCWRKAASNCFGTCASKASATTIIGTAIQVRAPTRSAASPPEPPHTPWTRSPPPSCC